MERLGAPETVSVPSFALEADAGDAHDAALVVFVVDSAALEEYRAQIVEAALGDRLTWVAYPKAGQLGTDLGRDRLAASLAMSGVRPVRQIAVDGVWSALRFRSA